MSINERSFSVFGKEKLLKSIENQFSTYFRMQGFTLEDLHTYPTPEPLFEYIHPGISKGDILIIVQVASGAHKWGKTNFENLTMEKSFRPFKAYGQSKLANVLLRKRYPENLFPIGLQ